MIDYNKTYKLTYFSILKMGKNLAGILRGTKRVILPVICGCVFPETIVYLSSREEGLPDETDEGMKISDLLKLFGLQEFQIEDYTCLYKHFAPEAGQNLANFLGKKVEVRYSHPAVIGVCEIKSYKPRQISCYPS